ncbi:hypothetical protein MJ579_10635 [Klebsiella pneumoniae]|nr:hypothetical protein MJ579_10635 [Klebsiella pneumoniae]
MKLDVKRAIIPDAVTEHTEDYGYPDDYPVADFTNNDLYSAHQKKLISEMKVAIGHTEIAMKYQQLENLESGWKWKIFGKRRPGR